MTFREFVASKGWAEKATRYGWDEAKARRLVEGGRELRKRLGPIDGSHSRDFVIRQFWRSFLAAEGFSTEAITAYDRETRLDHPVFSSETKVPEELRNFVFLFWCTDGVEIEVDDDGP